MIRLVVDLGGTNCRLALASTVGQATHDHRSYSNSAFSSFNALLRHYFTEVQQPEVCEMVIAVAGPVHNQVAQLTNRNWQLVAQKLVTDFGATRVALLNDLSALGHALPQIRHQDLISLQGDIATRHAQNLIVGIGTGFNVSPIVTTDLGTTCLVSEFGHVALPLDVYLALEGRIGTQANVFRTVESCFSGRGFEALFTAIAPDSEISTAKEIMKQVPPAQPRSAARFIQQSEPVLFTRFYAQMLALLSRNLLMAFLPRGGIIFAGTVARSLLTSCAADDFIKSFTQPEPQFPEIAAPVACILDDTAALKGCVQYQFTSSPKGNHT